VEYRPAAGLIPFANNARTHSDAQVAQIAASIREFGWTNPSLVNSDNGIVAGHEPNEWLGGARALFPFQFGSHLV
jgi:hypothetical protein